MSEPPEPSSVICRRCGVGFAIAPGAVLPACPSCGAAPRPLLGRFRDNRVAATLATLALGVLAAALTMPFMAMTTLGERRQFSLPGGIAQLYRDGHPGLSLILLTFSVLFPIAKLLALLVATSRLARVSPRTRRALHAAADVTGKYSILDVLVVAVLIVLIKFRGVAEVTAMAGVYWFCGAVLLSVAAGACVRLEDPAPTVPTPTVPASRRS